MNYYLLVGGSFEGPSSLRYSFRKRRDNKRPTLGCFLKGVLIDLERVTKALKNGPSYTTLKLYKSIPPSKYRKKSTILNEIKNVLIYALKKGGSVTLYYAGHGEKGSGNWCFGDGTVSVYEILDLMQKIKNMKEYKKRALTIDIVSDCCYSGQWIKTVNNKNKYFKDVQKTIGKKYYECVELTIKTACDYNEKARENEKGGLYTQQVMFTGRMFGTLNFPKDQNPKTCFFYTIME